MTAAPQIGSPTPGYFKRRLVRGGPFVAARVWVQPSEVDPETGEPISDEMILCEVDGKMVDAFDAWPWLAGNAITEAEYLFLTADAEHARAHRLDDPKALPQAAVDFAALGHNSGNPISAADMLLHDPIPAQVETLDHAHAAVLWIKRAQAMGKKLGTAKREAEEPHKAAMQAAGAAFRATAERIERERLALLARLHRWRLANGMPPISTDYGARAYTRATAKMVVDDPAALPRAYLAPDLNAIRLALESGAQVPGARLVEESTTVVS